MMYEFSSTFKTIQFTEKLHVASNVYVYTCNNKDAYTTNVVFSNFNQMVSFEYFILWFICGET